MDEDTAKVIGIIAIIGMMLAIIAYALLSPKDYTMNVKVISWEYGIHIEEFKVEHHTEERSHPNDAYNVNSSIRTRTKTTTDADGNTHTKFETYTVYSYDVNRWVETRCVTTTGKDKSPYFGEYTLKESNRTDCIGAERVKYQSKEYSASGQLVGSDDMTLHTVPISESMWETLTTNDQINYLQSKVGQPYAVSVAQ